MAQFYNITGFKESGEPWSNSYGTFQTYWADFEGIEGGVMLSKKQGTPPSMGQVYGDLIQATSQKGNQYWKFKSQQIPQGVERPASTPAQAQAQAAVATPPVNVSETVPGWFTPFINELGEVHAKLDHLVTLTEALVEQTKDVTVTPVGIMDKPDAETQAKLDEIFGDEPEPQDV